MSDTKTILLTGAAGFIGSEVARQMLDDGCQVVGIDNLNDYYPVTLKEYRLGQLKGREGFEFFPIDVEDVPSLTKLFNDYEFSAVVNLAARAGVRASIEEPEVYQATNATGCLNLLQQMRQHNIKKIVLASTSSLYAGQPMPFEESSPVNRPISPYAASKKAAEVMAYTYHHLFDIDVSIVRYFTVYGPAGRPDMSPYRFINWVANEQPIQLYGDGEQKRDFTYVSDIAAGTIAAMKDVGYEVFNLGGSQPFSILDMIGRIEKLVGKKAIIEHLPTHPTDMKATWAATEKAATILDWKAVVDFDEGLRKTYEWHRDYFNFVAETVTTKELPTND